MPYKEFIESEQAWLEQNETVYREALANIASPDYVRGLLRGIVDMLSPAIGYNPMEQPPHVAVHVLGVVQASLSKLLTELSFIDHYEERRDELEKIINSESQPNRTTGGDRFGYGNEQ